MKTARVEKRRREFWGSPRNRRFLLLVKWQKSKLHINSAVRWGAMRSHPQKCGWRLQWGGVGGMVRLGWTLGFACHLYLACSPWGGGTRFSIPTRHASPLAKAHLANVWRVFVPNAHGSTSPGTLQVRAPYAKQRLLREKLARITS